MNRFIIIATTFAFSTAAMAGATSLSADSFASASKNTITAQRACRDAFMEGTAHCRSIYDQPDQADDLAACLEGVRIAFNACMEAAGKGVTDATMLETASGTSITFRDSTGEADSVDLYRVGKDGREHYVGSADVDADGTVLVRLPTLDARRIQRGGQVFAVWFAGDDIVSEKDIKVRR